LAPPFFSIVIPHLAVFSALVLIHQAINDVLELNQRYLPLSGALGLALLIGLVTFTSIHPNVDMRIYTIDNDRSASGRPHHRGALPLPEFGAPFSDPHHRIRDCRHRHDPSSPHRPDHGPPAAD
jgi:hypothetical protein